jgi:hypothetical protein
MIFYRPTDGDPHTSPIEYHPRTCFLMTQLGSPSDEVLEIRQRLVEILSEFDIKLIDANSKVTGKDFLFKIWTLLLAVPLGVAVIDEKMRPSTLCNIFYELGVLQAYGKESLVIKTEAATIPSDFVRTEYVKYDKNFEERMRKFLDSFLKQADYYETMADQVEKNPLLSVDYLRRAYLISGKEELRAKVQDLMSAVALIDRARNSVETLLANF